MSKLRSINTVVWSDTWFETLNPSAKLLFIYLFTNEKTNMLGVYEISLRKVSFETGIPIEDVDKYLKDFELSFKIKYHNNMVLLLNFLKHQNYNFNMMKSAIRIYNKLPKELKFNNISEIEENLKGFETLCNGFAGVSKEEVELEVEYELEVEVEDECKKFVDDFQKFKILFYKNLSDDYDFTFEIQIIKNLLNQEISEEKKTYLSQKLNFLISEKRKKVAPKKENQHLEFIEELKNSKEWLDIISMQNKNISHDAIILKLIEFNNHLKTDLKVHSFKSDFTSHFKNWLPKKIPEKKIELQHNR